MQINGLLRSASSASPSMTPDANLAAASASAAADKAAPPHKVSDTFREILARYDMQNISPREFTELIQSLYNSGSITEEQYRELSLIRLELDEAKLDPNQQIDLLKFYGERMADQQKEFERLSKRAERNPDIGANLEASLGGVTRRLQWVQKFAAVNARADSGALDTMA